jgi:hypothetical protein
MRKSVTRSQPTKALKVDRKSQPDMGLDKLLSTPAAVDLPCQEYPTPTWFTHSGGCDISIIIPVTEFNAAVSKSIDMMPLRPKPNVAFHYLVTSDESAVSILKAWEKRRSKKTIGRIFKVSHFGSNIRSVAAQIQSELTCFLHPESLPDQYWLTALMKQPNSAPLLVWRDKIFDQCVYSAGVDWHNNKFVHIGRDFWNGMLMPTPHDIRNLPSEYRLLNQHTLSDWNGLIIRTIELNNLDTSYESLGSMLIDYATSHNITINTESIVTVCKPYMLCDGLDLTRYYNKWIASGKLKGNRPQRILVKKTHDAIREAGEAASRLRSKNTLVIFFTDKPEELEGVSVDRIVTDEALVSNRTFHVYYDLDGSQSFEETLGLR